MSLFNNFNCCRPTYNCCQPCRPYNPCQPDPKPCPPRPYPPAPGRNDFFIPISSGANALVTTVEGQADSVTLIGFGHAEQHPEIERIDLNAATTPINFSFTNPFDATLKSLSLTMNLNQGLELGAEALTLEAILYTSTNGVFTRLNTPKLVIGTLTGSVPAGTLIRNNIQNLNVAIPKNTRIMLGVIATGGTGTHTIRGYISAGIGFAA